MTPEALARLPTESFQRAWSTLMGRVSYDGYPLKADGVAGSRTLWARQMAGHSARRIAITQRAARRLGNPEPNGDNRSELADMLNRRCGVPLGSPYCASGVSWCLSDEHHDFREAHAMTLLHSLRPVSFDELLPGDVGGAPTGATTGHVGIVMAKSVDETLVQLVWMVEFNHRNRVALVRRYAHSLEFGSCERAAPACPSSLPNSAADLVPWGYHGTR